jgi:hypothetical protein
MAKKKQKAGCLSYLGAILIVLIVAASISFANIFRFETVVTYGPIQYLSNIKNFHQDLSFYPLHEFLIYKKPIKMTEEHKSKSIATINEGNIFKFKGYRTKEHSTWLAVKIYNGIEPVYGYIFIPNKIRTTSFMAIFKRIIEDHNYGHPGFFRELTGQENLLRKRLQNNLIDVLQTEYNLKQAKAHELQRIKDDNNLKLINFLDTDKHYYINATEYDRAKDLYDMYIGSNYEALRYQMLSDYDPLVHGYATQSILVKLSSSKIFKGFFVIFLLFAMIAVLRKKRTCPKCKSSNIVKDHVQLVKENYKYLTKSGKPDKRKKNNPLVSLNRVSMKCNDCSNTWSYDFEKET